MKLQLYFFIILFFSLKNLHIKCQNRIAEDKIDNIRKEINSTEISLNYRAIQEESITFLNSKYISLNDDMIEKDLLIHIFPIDCKINVDIENSRDSILLKNIDDESYSFKIFKNNLKNLGAKINLSLKQNNEDIKNRN